MSIAGISDNVLFRFEVPDGFRTNILEYRNAETNWSITKIELNFKFYWFVHPDNFTFENQLGDLKIFRTNNKSMNKKCFSEMEELEMSSEKEFRRITFELDCLTETSTESLSTTKEATTTNQTTHENSTETLKNTTAIVRYNSLGGLLRSGSRIRGRQK